MLSPNRIKDIMILIEYFYNPKKSDLTPLSKEGYKQALIDVSEEKAKKAFEMAWDIRNFEIEMYWKRANYFWAFIASTFVGYFALINSGNYTKPDDFNHVEVYFLICIGFVLSVAWILTNKGSKSWQRNWEAHVDLLEDRFTGPLYKTVLPQKTYSVSKINEIISVVFAMIWFLLGVKFIVQQGLINFCDFKINWLVLVSTLGVFFAIMAMLFGYGRARFSERSFIMHRRNIIYEEIKSK
jgi:hypothetical protein